MTKKPFATPTTSSTLAPVRASAVAVWSRKARPLTSAPRPIRKPGATCCMPCATRCKRAAAWARPSWRCCRRPAPLRLPPRNPNAKAQPAKKPKPTLCALPTWARPPGPPHRWRQAVCMCTARFCTTCARSMCKSPCAAWWPSPASAVRANPLWRATCCCTTWRRRWANVPAKPGARPTKLANTRPGSVVWASKAMPASTGCWRWTKPRLAKPRAAAPPPTLVFGTPSASCLPTPWRPRRAAMAPGASASTPARAAAPVAKARACAPSK